MISGVFLHTNFSVKHRTFVNVLTFIFAIKPLLFLYIVGGSYLLHSISYNNFII
nr:hypothetical protein [uncultured bacterium]